MARQINIQDGFLFEHLKEGREVAVALTTGKALRGFAGGLRRLCAKPDAG